MATQRELAKSELEHHQTHRSISAIARKPCNRWLGETRTLSTSWALLTQMTIVKTEHQFVKKLEQSADDATREPVGKSAFRFHQPQFRNGTGVTTTHVGGGVPGERCSTLDHHLSPGIETREDLTNRVPTTCATAQRPGPAQRARAEGASALCWARLAATSPSPPLPWSFGQGRA